MRTEYIQSYHQSFICMKNIVYVRNITFLIKETYFLTKNVFPNETKNLFQVKYILCLSDENGMLNLSWQNNRKFIIIFK